MTDNTSTIDEIIDVVEAEEERPEGSHTKREPTETPKSEPKPTSSGSWIDDFSPWLTPRPDQTTPEREPAPPQHTGHRRRDVRALVDEIKRAAKKTAARTSGW